MRARLFPSLTHMTTFFSIAILCVTVAAFTLRLTVFSNIAAEPLPTAAAPVSLELEGDEFAYRMNAKIEFKAPDEKGSFQIENPETNAHYMRLEILRDDTGKSIYYSGFITPGSKIKSAYLQGEEMAPGTYECTAIITAFDHETKEQVGSQEQAVTIVIQDPN